MIVAELDGGYLHLLQRGGASVGVLRAIERRPWILALRAEETHTTVKTDKVQREDPE